MAGFYSSELIQEIFYIFKVKEVVISGLNDENIINEILKSDINLISINQNEIQNIKTIKDQPLNALSSLKNYDAIFIDDDPNWYTLLNELKLINENNNQFPLVFICNNKFPNKRRDSYINPDSIPAKFRQEYEIGLPICYNDKKITIFDGLYHAYEENTPKNGVLTAIEDFISKNNHIGIMNIDFIEQITILYPKNQVNQKRIGILIKNSKNVEISDGDFLSKLIENELLISYIQEYNVHNKDLENLIVESSKKDNVILNYENEIKFKDTELDYKESQINSIKSRLSLKDSQIKNIESKLVNEKRKRTKLQDKIYEVNNQNNSTLEELNDAKIKFNEKIVSLTNDLENEKQEYSNHITQKDNIIDSLEEKLKQKDAELNYEKKQKDISLQQKDNLLKSKQNELDKKEDKINGLQRQNIHQLSKMVNKGYCISCFKDEISNNHAEIRYLKNNTLIKKILSPLGYLYLLLKSNPNEISLNLNLYKALKDSECFDIGFYLNNNKDLIESKWCKYFSPELHYVCNGFTEKRTFNKKYFNRNSKKDLLEYLLTCDK